MLKRASGSEVTKPRSLVDGDGASNSFITSKVKEALPRSIRKTRHSNVPLYLSSPLATNITEYSSVSKPPKSFSQFNCKPLCLGLTGVGINFEFFFLHRVLFFTKIENSLSNCARGARFFLLPYAPLLESV